ncbi:protein sel-1 homolog 1-like [Stylonychia lemnae]|uniref:Protein sel-1 homolog 1-like n=1 Tax=Stylonychia lemnae TaxID=5949 RepID=A0A078AIJ8_STYLE|nr:protein sel-1 homolog 1-like [Stylonychia lemnae]|eukprot:CDW82044.1 protein sel-1 homolog 1-like [Stylonychia lemnae]
MECTIMSSLLNHWGRIRIFKSFMTKLRYYLIFICGQQQLKNGIFPNQKVLLKYIENDGQYQFLELLSDIKNELIKPDNFTIYDFKQEMTSKALINYYMASLVDPIYEQLLLKKDENDMAQIIMDKEYEKEINQKANSLKQKSLMAQMILGFRFKYGLGVPNKCKTSSLYYEKAAMQSIQYVEQTYGLDIVERKKLSIGPHVLQDKVQLADQSEDQSYNDMIDLLDLKGQYGNVESLSVLAIQHVHGTKRIKRDFLQARRSFEKALSIDFNDKDSNYYMGLMNLHGLGAYANVQKAVEYFKRAQNDSRALNALGYIYYTAPDYLEIDHSVLMKYGNIRQSFKEAKNYFLKAAENGNTNAQYNLGCLHLNPGSKEEYSFTQAYDRFRYAAEKGHTFSAYNVAVMHLLGIGTFESCQIAQLYLKHVAEVGQNTLLLKSAFSLTIEQRYKEAALIYMELAEQGLAVAQLNAAILFDKYDVIDNDKIFISDVAKRDKKDEKFNINKHLSHKYYQMAGLQIDTQDEANLKLGDFYYYGIACNQSYEKAIEMYRLVVSQSKDSELRGQAMFNLGIIHHFGMGVEIDLEMAQIYYDKAMKEESQALTPVYLLSLYGKWQKLDMLDTIKKFISIHSDSPRSQMTVLMMLICYFCTFAGMVKLLRRDYKRNH